MKRVLFALACLCILASCGSDSDQGAGKDGDSKKEQGTVSNDKLMNQTSLVGTYVGSLPCEDCDALTTTIILREDNSYAITTQPEKDTTFSMPLIDSGRFVMRDTILELTDMGGEARQYKIFDNKIQQLGPDGQPLVGKGKNNYEFLKQAKSDIK